jgi:hypothetical protein
MQPVPSDDEDLGLDQNLAQRMAAMGLRGKSSSGLDCDFSCFRSRLLVTNNYLLLHKNAGNHYHREDARQKASSTHLTHEPLFSFLLSDTVDPPSAILDLSDDDGGESRVDAVAVQPQQPAKRAARARRVATVISSDSGDDGDFLDDESSEDEAPTRKRGGKSAPARKKVVSKSSAASVENGSPGASGTTTAGAKKRVVKTPRVVEKAPQLKVQKLRISPFHKNSGPMPNIPDLEGKAPKFDEVRDHLPSATDLVEASIEATSRRPVRANRTKATYFQPQVLSSDSDDGNAGESDSSDFEE